MKQTFLLLAIVFTFSSFTTIIAKEKVETSIEIYDLLENEQVDDSQCRRRTCTYRNGQQISCTAWIYFDCGTVLNEVVVIAKK